jgi:hypothetical protein
MTDFLIEGGKIETVQFRGIPVSIAATRAGMLFGVKNTDLNV